jgi:hypothetical protein
MLDEAITAVEPNARMSGSTDPSDSEGATGVTHPIAETDESGATSSAHTVHPSHALRGLSAWRTSVTPVLLSTSRTSDNGRHALRMRCGSPRVRCSSSIEPSENLCALLFAEG